MFPNTTVKILKVPNIISYKGDGKTWRVLEIYKKTIYKKMNIL